MPEELAADLAGGRLPAPVDILGLAERVPEPASK